MANINFPSSPTDGQTYTFGTFTWKWVAATGTWDAISTSLSPPYGPSGAVQYNAAGAFGGATAFTSDGNGNVTIGATGSLTYNPGASGGVLYTNGSKVVTSGTALTFDGTKLTVAGLITSTTSGYTVNATGAVFGYYSAGGTPTTYIQAPASGQIQFWAPSTGAWATFDTSGNLGLGVTPSGWATITAMQIKNAHFGGYADQAYFGANAYYNGGWKYIGAAKASRIEQYNGEFQFFTAASGTAGNAITFTQAMTLDASGNLGVGVTSPSYKLHVGGNATFDNTTTGATQVRASHIGSGVSAGFLADDGSGAEIFSFTRQASNTLSISSYGAIGLASGATSGPTTSYKAILDSSGNLLITSTGGLGYGTGSGGAVTQGTNRTTGVTLNKTNGAITLVSAAGSTTWQTFTVTNSTVAATDTVIVCQKSGTDLNEIHVTAVAAGSFNITFRTTGGTTTEQPVFNFAVIKAVVS